MNTFDFTTISSELPPNTGPPGTVPTNNGNGSSSNTNKNLSHVPCKFYRQGICQAGSSCPFSHNFDGSLAAEKLPCKYFQKGNCKFGLKCALAHFLPDGTRVNSKSLRMSQPINTNVANGNGHLRRSSNNMNNVSFNHYTSQPIDINAESMENIGHQSNNMVSPSNNVAQFLNVGHKFPSQPGSYTQSLSRNSSFNSSLSGLPNSYTNGNTSASYNNHPAKSNNQSSAFFRSYSTNTSPPNLTTSPFYSNSSNAVAGVSQSPLNTPFSDKTANPFSIKLTSRSSFSSPTCLQNYDSAVIDDEDEEMYNDSGYFEDYVPGSLSDLILTPQEMQRRDSRSQSGTLLVRPNLNSTLSSNTNEEDEKKEDRAESKEDTKDKSEKNSTQDDVFLMD
mmetsp:Transcript_6577/g.6474  ORF Transcript_6577/g.6474 Transcript_6577/m.6474 type:complete len:391 (-) Transcript_6577:245-1417(-)